MNAGNGLGHTGRQRCHWHLASPANSTCAAVRCVLAHMRAAFGRNLMVWEHCGDRSLRHGTEALSEEGWAHWPAFLFDPAMLKSLRHLGHGCGSRTCLHVQVDASYNTQPENMESVWNLRGVINNAWHHVNIEAK